MHPTSSPVSGGIDFSTTTTLNRISGKDDGLDIIINKSVLQVLDPRYSSFYNQHHKSVVKKKDKFRLYYWGWDTLEVSSI